MAQTLSAHERLCDLARGQAALDVELGDAVLAAYRESCHVPLGYGSFREYTERFLGWTGRQTEERVRVALALEELLELRDALASGTLTWSSVRELTRVATRETEHEWIAAAIGRTAREVERLVARRERGDRPSDPPKPEAQRHRISLSLSAQAMALWESARDRLMRELGGAVDDDAFVTALATGALAASRDAGKSSYQIAMQVCERCSHAEQVAGRETVTVTPAVADAARCDATILGEGRASQTIPPRVRREVTTRHAHRCAVPGCAHSAWIDVHHVVPRSEGGRHDPELLVPLCSAHHTHVHEGRLVVRGNAREGFVFEHADGSAYGAASVSVSRAAAGARVLALLTGMGFKSSEAQRMVDAARPHVGAEASVEAILRAALRASEPLGFCGVREAAWLEYGKAAA